MDPPPLPPMDIYDRQRKQQGGSNKKYPMIIINTNMNQDY